MQTLQFDAPHTEADRIQWVIDALQRVHGPGHTSREKHGLHLMLACPECLAAWGHRERRGKHLTFNIEKYLGIGAYANRFAEGGKKGLKSGYALCMKEHRPFSYEELLAYPTLEERGYLNHSSRIVYGGNTVRYLINDGVGNAIPDHPGIVRPISTLPYDHPCMVFIRGRDLDPVQLTRHFRAAWCEEEAPEGEQYGNRWYRKHSDDGFTPWKPGSWKSTPQGRLILYSDVMGVQVAWQGRYLENKVPGVGTFVFHPYKKVWMLRPPWKKGEDPVKYVTATGSERNSQLCGYDAVKTVARAMPFGDRYCVLTEGPLDAARFPGHGLAVLGKYLSENQALLVAAEFTRAILAFDGDKPGREACADAEELLRSRGVQTKRLFGPHEGQDDNGNGPKLDPGGITYDEAKARIYHLLNS
jgi:hypothetical protein